MDKEAQKIGCNVWVAMVVDVATGAYGCIHGFGCGPDHLLDIFLAIS